MSSDDDRETPKSAQPEDAETPVPEQGTPVDEASAQRAQVAKALAAAAAGHDPVEVKPAFEPSADKPLDEEAFDDVWNQAARRAVDQETTPYVPTGSSGSSSNAGAWIAVGIICTLFTVILAGLNVAERRRQEQVWDNAFQPFGSNYDYGYGDPYGGDPLAAYDPYGNDDYGDSYEPTGDPIAIPPSMATRELPGACFERTDLTGDGYADKVVEKAYDSEGRILQQADDLYRIEFVYERGGRVVRERHLLRDDGTVTGEIVRRMDGNGNMVAEEYGDEVTRSQHRYDGAGRLLSTTTSFDGYTEQTIRSYDRRGNLVREEQREEDEVVSTTAHAYDRAGQKVRSEMDENADGLIEETIRFVYDSQGRVSQESTDWDGDGEAEVRTNYAYDSFGNLVRKSTNRFGALAEDITYDYRCFE